MTKPHSFHIPVMGIGYTIDSPFKVAHLGIDSVISLGDDILLEKLRKFYADKFKIPFKEITDKMHDFRAKRITSYLNLMNNLVDQKFEELKSKATEIRRYFSMLPEHDTVKNEYIKLTAKPINFEKLKSWSEQHLSKGKIDVNIMTKVDKANYIDGEKLPVEFNDAHAALRGFAESDLNSSLILSAGMNPRLYAYLENFEDFYPNEAGEIKKKIVLKVSDYRSALIQGKYLAKKGIWVSEYRVESGLNCGGHAFATDGFLLGPILAEFRDNKEEITQAVQELLVSSLTAKNRTTPKSPLSIKITAQGGVGTAEEHGFLLAHYKVDSVGWGSPFLLVPEAITIDDDTLNKLTEAKEEDLYLSNISPLGIPFNNLKGNSKDDEKFKYIAKNRPGSPCPKRYVALNYEFDEKGLCTASRQYQDLKLKALASLNLPVIENKKQVVKITEKSCICVGLGTAALLSHGIETKREGEGVSVCPGPNMAYFSHQMSLSNITDHIYGRANMITRTDRPNMFVKEVKLYLDYLADQIIDKSMTVDGKQEKYLLKFANNLKAGIAYYFDLFTDTKNYSKETQSKIHYDLKQCEQRLDQLFSRISILKQNLELKEVTI